MGYSVDEPSLYTLLLSFFSCLRTSALKTFMAIPLNGFRLEKASIRGRGSGELADSRFLKFSKAMPGVSVPSRNW